MIIPCIPACVLGKGLQGFQRERRWVRTEAIAYVFLDVEIQVREMFLDMVSATSLYCSAAWQMPVCSCLGTSLTPKP